MHPRPSHHEAATILLSKPYLGDTMPAFNNVAAYGHAVTIVTAALQSGVVKLVGPSRNDDLLNADALKRDSEYINGLINSIATNLQS
jgi:hypothetical protein